MEIHSQGIMNIPSLKTYRLFGNIFEFQRDRLGLFTRIYQENGDIGIFYVGKKPVIMVNASELIQDILVTYNSHMGKIPLLKTYLDPLLGNGILNADNDTNRVHKRMMAPAFHRQAITHYAHAIIHSVQKMTALWANGATIDLHSAMMQITLTVITEALFGTNVTADAVQIGNDFLTVSRHITDQTTALLPIPLSWKTPSNRRFWNALARMNTTIQRIIQTRRQSKMEYHDLLAMLMTARYDDGTVLSDRQIRDEIMTMLFAGHDTTGNGLAWTWYLLLQHPSILQQLQDELDHQLQGQQPQVDDLSKLPFALQVFKESLRLYPPVYIIPRYVKESFHLGSYFIPAGSNLGISPYVVHRRADYFPSPHSFNPNHFTPESESQRPRYAYLPFSAGPRMCIGAAFALMEAHLIVAVIAQRFTFIPTNSTPVLPEPLITLRPKGMLHVRVTQRMPQIVHGY